MIAFALVAALTLGAAADDKKEAGAHYQRAVGFYKEGDFQGALTEFRAAYEVIPSYEVLFNIALCERRLFNYARAMRTLDQYMMEGGSRIALERREAVAREVAAIKVLTAPVAVIVDGPPAAILVDGEKVGETPLQELLVLSVGKHTVRAEREGCSPDERRLEVSSGQAQSVQLSPASLTAPVEVAVYCSPPTATVSVDGADPVACPATLAVVPGNHELVGRAPGFIAQRTEVLVQPGQARKVSLALVELPPRAPPFPTLGVSLVGGGVAVGGVGIAFAASAAGRARSAPAPSFAPVARGTRRRSPTSRRASAARCSGGPSSGPVAPPSPRAWWRWCASSRRRCRWRSRCSPCQEASPRAPPSDRRPGAERVLLLPTGPHRLRAALRSRRAVPRGAHLRRGALPPAGEDHGLRVHGGQDAPVRQQRRRVQGGLPGVHGRGHLGPVSGQRRPVPGGLRRP